MAEAAKQYEVEKSDEEWRRTLTPEQYPSCAATARSAQAPARFDRQRPGAFTCVGCEQPLFVADRKFESGTGWPSFFAPIEGAIGTTMDRATG